MSDGCESPPVAGAFVADGDAWRFDGALTLENAATVMAATQALAFPPSGRSDRAGLTRADSAALAVVMALRRRAQAEGRTVVLENVPPGVASLADVYGVEDLVRAVA